MNADSQLQDNDQGVNRAHAQLASGFRMIKKIERQYGIQKSNANDNDDNKHDRFDEYVGKEVSSYPGNNKCEKAQIRKMKNNSGNRDFLEAMADVMNDISHNEQRHASPEKTSWKILDENGDVDNYFSSNCENMIEEYYLNFSPQLNDNEKDSDLLKLRPQRKEIRGWYIWDHLGQGGFGSVDMVVNSKSGLIAALKRVNIKPPSRQENNNANKNNGTIANNSNNSNNNNNNNSIPKKFIKFCCISYLVWLFDLCLSRLN